MRAMPCPALKRALAVDVCPAAPGTIVDFGFRSIVRHVPLGRDVRSIPRAPGASAVRRTALDVPGVRKDRSTPDDIEEHGRSRFFIYRQIHPARTLFEDFLL